MLQKTFTTIAAANVEVITSYHGCYVLVISRYEDDIVVITRDRGGAEVECNNNDIIRVTGIQGKRKRELVKIVVIYRILYQWSSQNCVNLATSTQSSVYHTISASPHKTVY